MSTDVPEHAWMVRAGNDNELAEEIGEKRVVAIGWDKIGSLSQHATRSEVKEQYASTYPDHSKHRRSINAGQLYRFVHEISEGDYVLSYVKADREYLVGQVNGGYDHRPDLFEASLSSRMTHVRLSAEIRGTRSSPPGEIGHRQKNDHRKKPHHRLRALLPALVAVGAPKAVLGEVQMQIALGDPSKASPPGFEHRPLAFGRVTVRSLFADVLFAVLDAPVFVDFPEKPISAPRIGVYLAALLHVRERRGEETLFVCRAAKFEDAPFASALDPGNHQRATCLVGTPSALRKPPHAGRTAVSLLAHLAALLSAFDVDIVGLNFSRKLRKPALALLVKGLAERLRHPSGSLRTRVDFLTNRPSRPALVQLAREVHPAPQAHVGGFQKRARRVNKPLVARFAMVAMQTVAIVTLTRLHLLGAALRATRTVGPTHLPPRFGATGLVGQKGFLTQRHDRKVDGSKCDHYEVASSHVRVST